MLRFTALIALLGALMAPSPTSAEDLDPETARLNSLALDRFLDGQARVMRVADPIRVAAAPFCGDDVASVIGVYAAYRTTFLNLIPRDLPFEKKFNETAVARFELEKRPRILLVAPGLPASQAGVQPGDLVIRVHGKRVNRYVQLDSLRPSKTSERVRLTVARADEPAEIEIEIESQLGCDDPSRFMFGTDINAFATHYGRNTGIYVFGGMLQFVNSDDELAVIMGHELAHMILKHTQTRATQKTESDADYLGLYLAARAGFDVSKAIDIEDRLGRTNPYSTLDWGYYSHPMSPARSLLLRSTIAEIARKLERGDPLEPERGS